MKKFNSLLLAVLGLLCSMSVSAHDFEVDGIYYNFPFLSWDNDSTVEVTYRGTYPEYDNDYYSGVVKIPESVTYNGTTYRVTSIGSMAFINCPELTSVVIPNSVTSIGNEAFQSCSSLTSVVIPNSVTDIWDGAFNGCSSLTSVVIPNGVTGIWDYAFYRCSSLTSVEIPNSVTRIGNDAFYATALYNNQPDGIIYSGNFLLGYKGTGFTTAKIKAGTKLIADRAFEGSSGLTSVEIPNSVTSIGSCAFYNCPDLTSVYIEDIAAWCKIEFVDKESNPLDYNSSADPFINFSKRDLYLNGEKVTELVIPDGVTSIGNYAFYIYSDLTSVVIPNSVTSIGYRAFEGCSSLTSVEIPNSVISIGDWAFLNCSGLTSVVIPNSVTSIGEGAVAGCSSLTSVVISNSVTSIGYEAFYGCSSLTSVEIPNSVTSIGSYAFYGCSGLTSVVIPNSVTSIGESAFSGCSGLTSVEIPNSVTDIWGYAFSGCSGLTSVEIGSSVTSIGWYAFSGCSSLTNLISYAEEPPTCGNNAFSGIYKENCVLQVPGSSLAAYQQADQWKDFLFIEDVLTAIGGVTVDGAVPATADVYSTNGMLIKRNAELKNLKHELPAGIYIIGGKKVWVK